MTTKLLHHSSTRLLLSSNEEMVVRFMSLEEKSLVLRVTKQNGQNVTISLPTNVLRKKLDLKSLILDGEMLASSFKC